jgi:4-diphosphocytidyl-2-C-methyl-D-erythritol kinase
MVLFPPCKINLGLHIVNKRPDGYHDLETCFYPVPWTDVLEIIPSAETTFTSSGDPIPGNQEENLCLKAYRLLAADFNLGPVKIHLHKIIPTGAGLGGGSSDAAYTLRALNAIFALGLSQEQLMRYAAQLGSDCSFFIQDRPMIGTGRGEILRETSLSLAGKFLTLVNPDVHVSTAEAYSGVRPSPPEVELKTVLEKTPVAEWKDLLKNDFEESVFKKHPVIREIKEELYGLGAMYACMSGSGSTVFAIFEREVSIDTPYRNTWKGFITV